MAQIRYLSDTSILGLREAFTCHRFCLRDGIFHQLVRDDLQLRVEYSTEYEFYRRYDTGTRFVEEGRVLKAEGGTRSTNVRGIKYRVYRTALLPLTHMLAEIR